MKNKCIKLFKVLALSICLILASTSITNVFAATSHVTYYSDTSKTFSYDEPYRIVQAHTRAMLTDLTRNNSGYFHVEPGQELCVAINFNTPWDWANNRAGIYTGMLEIVTRTNEHYSMDATYGCGCWYATMPIFEPMDFYILIVPDGQINIQQYFVNSYAL